MFFLILAISCSVAVSVLLKLAKRYEVNVPQAVMWNYGMAALLSLIVYKPAFSRLNFPDVPYWLFLSLSVLLPVLFLILGRAVRYSGIVRTDLAQRLSVFVPVVAAFVFMNEPVVTVKIVGLCVAFLAIMLSIPWSKKHTANGGIKDWGYLLLVFAGMGTVDILFKQLAAYQDVSYTTSLFLVFFTAFVFCGVAFVIQRVRNKVRFGIQHMLAGVILGCFNFGNILFYLKAHQVFTNNPTLVFAVTNVGVIALGTMIGIGVFKEHLSGTNKIGIVVALIAIVILTYFR